MAEVRFVLLCSHTASIHILDDDAFLDIIPLYHPFLLGEYGNDNERPVGGMGRWGRECWWYKLAHHRM